MSDLRNIGKVRVRLPELVSAYKHFRAMGQRKLEGVALWVGKFNGNDFDVTGTVIPKQRGISSDTGLLYVVGEAELRRLNVWLYENQLRLVAQLHSHPGRAYHSETDDDYPIMTTLGGFSLVVPDFAAGLPLLSNCAIFRLTTNSWEELSEQEVADTFNLT